LVDYLQAYLVGEDFVARTKAPDGL
jgi:hypothetical protein